MRRMMAADEKQAWSSEKAHFPSQSASSASEPYPAYPTSPESFTSLASAESYGGEQDGSALDQKRVEKSLVRKLDWCVLPVLVVMCAFTVVDKAGVSIALIDGIQQDLNITQTQFNTGAGLFNVGLLIFQLPSNILITRLRPASYLSGCCIAWSIIAACHAAMHNYAQYLVVRLLLGIAEAPFLAGAIFLLSTWYTRSEMAMRSAFILGMIVLALVFVNPASGAIMHDLRNKHALPGWKWLYLIYGACGLCPGIAGFLLLPDYPESKRKVWWMTEQERMVAISRLKADRVNEKTVERQKLLTGFLDAVKDKRTWVFVLMYMSRKALEGLYVYLQPIFYTITKQLFDNPPIDAKTLALLLGSAPILLAAIIAFVFAYTSDRFSERTYHLAVPLSFALVGLIISSASVNPVARYISSYLYLAGHIAGTALFWAWVSATLQETPEKKAIGIAIINVVGGVGAIWSPFLFRGQDAPWYMLAFRVLAAFDIIDIICCFVMKAILTKQNKRLRDGPDSAGERQLYAT